MDSLSCKCLLSLQRGAASTPDSQLMADGSKAVNPVSGVVPPECCRLLHLLTLLLTLWGECSHICLCVCDVTVPVALTTCFIATITVALINACKGLYSIQIFLALRYSSLDQICLCSAAFYNVSRVTKCHIITFTELQFVCLLTMTFTLKSNMICLELFSKAKRASAEL